MEYEYDIEESLSPGQKVDPETAPLKTCVKCNHALNTYNHGVGICFSCQEKGRTSDDSDKAAHTNTEAKIEIGYPTNVLSVVCGEYGVPLAVLRDSWGSRTAIEARHVVSWILGRHGRLSKQEIARTIHARNGTGTGTNYACKRVEQRMEKDPVFAERVQHILENCGPPPDE